MTEQEVAQLAAFALEQRGHPVLRQDTWLQHRDSRFSFVPRLVEVHRLTDGGFRTVTTMTTYHPDFAPSGIFEFQHAAGDALVEAVGRGFDEWVQVDLPVLLDAERDKAEHCGVFEMRCSQKEGSPPLNRRALLGPIVHFVQNPSCAVESDGSGEEEHPFCPCCLLTNTFEAFRSLIEGTGFFGIRLVAVRDETGSPCADCRVNGEDWDVGAQVLRDYIGRWPQLGYELRKQYVVLQNLPSGQTSD